MNSDAAPAGHLRSEVSPQAGFLLFFAIAIMWLAVSVQLVRIDLYDGYTTIVNSQYFLGISESYSWQRGPLLGVFLVPAEWLAQRLDLYPLDVRPHHALMALLHAVYLAGTWQLLRTHFGTTAITLTAYLAAIPTFAFFSYAPFVSHDIIPGLMALVLVVQAYGFMQAPSAGRWFLLFALGAALALLKQTYALVWVAVLAACLTQFIAGSPGRARSLRPLLLLAASAIAGGIVCWLTYAALMAERFPHTPFLLRPLEIVHSVSLLYLHEGEPRDVFYQAIYLRNLSAYGLAAVPLVLPGLAMSLVQRGTLLQAVAIAWLLLLALMLLTPFKEVRYLIFLAPLTAVLLIPVLQRLWALRKAYRFGVVGLLILNAAYVIPEAARVRHPFYQVGVSNFLAPISADATTSGTIYYERYLSFVSPERTAFFGDRYHRITHLDAELIGALFGIPAARFRRLDMSQFPATVAAAGAQDVFLLASHIAARVRPYLPGNTTGIDPGFLQSISRPEDIALIRDGDGLKVAGNSAAPILLVAQKGTQSSLVLVRDGDEIAALDVVSAASDETARIKGLRLHALCTLAGCESFDSDKD
jgi:hypothetical protein